MTPPDPLELAWYPTSDLGNAKRLAARAEGLLRWVDLGAPRRAAGASANARPQAPGAQRRNSAEDEAAEAASQHRELLREEVGIKGGSSSLCGDDQSAKANESAGLIDAGDEAGATTSLPPCILPAPSD